jgi:group I intron endonuclease
MIIYIYTLSDPLTGEIRYIGKTNNLKTRYQTHVTTIKKSHCSRWIHSLIKNGSKPIMEVLDIVGESNWVLMEQYWISQFKTWGFRLCNHTQGGEGMYGYTPKHTLTKAWAEQSSKIHKGKKVSQKVRDKISTTLTGTVLSESTKNKIRKRCVDVAEEQSTFILHTFCKNTNKLFGTFRTGMALSKKLNCAPSCVTMCLNGTNKSVKGIIIHRINCIK